MSELHGRERRVTSLPETAPLFKGFPDFRSNVLYCPKQFFSVVLPHSSVNCIRLVSYMLRKTLGWVNESGEPVQEQHEFSHRELEQAAGVSHSRLPEAIADAVSSNFIRLVQKARIQTQGVRAQSAAYELCWDERHYTDDPSQFKGFFLQPTYLDTGGQTRLGRKNIPNVFFDYLIRNESRGVIRTVGTLLWYSIDWGKGGERKQPVKRSLRELVDLTCLDKSSIVRALDEAAAKGYVERIERGVFDLTGQKESSTTVYGIRWTNEYTYTYEGLAVKVTGPFERSQNATQPPSGNAPKMQHGIEAQTLPKCDTGDPRKHSQNATRNALKTQHGERSQNATKSISKTVISKTSIHNNNSSPTPTAVVAESLLLKAGFDRNTAREIAEVYPQAVIEKQIELLPKRHARKNPLGLLRRAIEENWDDPAEQTTDVGSSAGKNFAANFYAGYHGNPETPATNPSPADSDAAEAFVSRLLAIWSDQSLVPVWGRQFGGMVAHEHGKRRQSFPALRPALQQYGDNFYSRLRASREAERQKLLEEARSKHYQQFEADYLEYLKAELVRHQSQNSKLFQALLREEAEKLEMMRSNRFGLNVERWQDQYRAGRLERFQQILFLEEDHDVLDFWTWDKERNQRLFKEASV